MRKLSERLAETFKRIDGLKFKGILTIVSDNAGKERLEYRILLVRKPCLITIGDIVYTNNGEMILLMEHPDSTPYEVNFKAAYIAKAVSWKRKGVMKDAVSGAKRDTYPVDLGPLYINLDMPQDIPLSTMSEIRYRFLTGQDVRIGDVVDGKTVKTLHDVLGVKLGYAE